MRAFAVIGAIVALTAVYADEGQIVKPTGVCLGADGTATVKKAWLDVIFLVDASNAMTQNGVRNVEAFIKSAFRQMTVGKDTADSSRAGVIYYAATAETGRDITVADDSLAAYKYTGGAESNLKAGIEAAQKMFDDNKSDANHHQVIVIAASTYKSGGQNDPTQAAAAFKESGGDIITIDYNKQKVSPLAKDLASNGFSFTNNDNEVSNLFNAFLSVNCFCNVNQYAMVKSENNAPVGGCIGEEKFRVDWESASAMCNEEGAHLIKVDTAAEKTSLKDLSEQPFWIGLKYDDAQSKWVWEDKTVLADGLDTGLTGAAGLCVYNNVDKWETAFCAGDADGKMDFIYYCEFDPCAAGTDCFHPEPKPDGQ